MKAAEYQAYGPPEVLTIEEVERPSLRDTDEGRVLVRVHCASVNPYDYLFRSGFLPTRMENGLLKPKQKMLGIDVACTIEAVSVGVDKFKVGDRVFGSCLGSHAEYVRARQNAISLMPVDMTFAEGAAIPTAALTALQALRNVAQVTAGQRVLINGASGGVGHFAVQLARAFEMEVTAVCGTSNVTWVRGLGAHEVLDYTQVDFTRSGQRYDVVLDAVGKSTYAKSKRVLKPAGVYVTENPLKSGALNAVQILLASLLKDKRVRMHLTKPGSEDLDFLRGLFEQGKLRPVIEKVYPLDQIAAAHRHVQNGHTKGKVVVEIQKGVR